MAATHTSPEPALLQLPIKRLKPSHAADPVEEILPYIAGICGTAIHMAFVVMFIVLNVPNMAIYNILGCVLWAVATLMAANGQPTIAIHLAAAEALVHAVIATVIVGTAFGFHYYLWSITVMVAVNPSLSIPLAMMLSSISMLIFSALSRFVNTDLSHAYSDTIITSFNTFNILAAGLSMIGTGIVVRRIFTQQADTLQKHAGTDALTGLHNRRHMHGFLNQLESQQRQTNEPFCLCICDLDHFKSINDVHGHDVGDEVLVDFGRFLSRSIRPYDQVARWGGEEFMVILTNTREAEATDIVNRLIQQLRTDECIEITDGLNLSMSVGIAESTGELELKDLIIRADQALYRAKEEGRDRAVTYGH